MLPGRQSRGWCDGGGCHLREYGGADTLEPDQLVDQVQRAALDLLGRAADVFADQPARQELGPPKNRTRMARDVAGYVRREEIAIEDDQDSAEADYVHRTNPMPASHRSGA